MKLSVFILPLALVGASVPVISMAEPSTTIKERPLQGSAWKIANQAYKSFNNGNYLDSEKKAKQAIKLRPDVLRLRILLIYALQKQNKIDEAREVLSSAEREGFPSGELLIIRNNLNNSQTQKSTSDEYKRAFPFAEIGYSSYREKDYKKSAMNAEKAFRIDPSQGDWALLWINALEAQKKYQEAIEASDIAIDLGATNKNDLIGRKQSMQRLIAIPYAENGYLSTNPVDAIENARKAVEIAPDVSSHRLLLITSLMRMERFAEAESAASAAIEINSEDTTAYVLRGYLRHLLGRHELARQDFDLALKHDWLDKDELDNIKLIAADGSIAAGDFDNAMGYLNSMDKDDPRIIKRVSISHGVLKEENKKITSALYPPPVQDCRNTPYGTVCSLMPSDSLLKTDTALAYDYFSKKDYQKAIEHARNALSEMPDDIDRNRLFTTTLSAGNNLQKEEALERLNIDIKNHPENSDLLMQRGYLYTNTNRHSLAINDIRAARATGNAPDNAILAEGFAQAASGDRDGALLTLKNSIDLANSGELNLSKDELMNTRGAVSSLSRKWGALATVGYRGGRAATTYGSSPIVVPGKAVFSTAEFYWKPFDNLNSGKTNFELYTRLTNTLHSGKSQAPQQSVKDPCSGNESVIASSLYSGVSGFPTSVASMGARFTPNTDWGVNLGLERQFLIGSAARKGGVSPSSRDLRCSGTPVNQIEYQVDRGDGGWLAYASWGYYYGTERKLDVPSWWTMDSYVQAGWSWQKMDAKLRLNGSLETMNGDVSRDQGFASAEMRLGRSIRMDQLSEKLVLFPHVVVGIDWLKTKDSISFHQEGKFRKTDSDSNTSNWAGSVGVGVGARYWFREDKYHAPRSYIDWSLQYRTNVGGKDSQRAKGVYMSLSLSY